MWLSAILLDMLLEPGKPFLKGSLGILGHLSILVIPLQGPAQATTACWLAAPVPAQAVAPRRRCLAQQVWLRLPRDLLDTGSGKLQVGRPSEQATGMQARAAPAMLGLGVVPVPGLGTLAVQDLHKLLALLRRYLRPGHVLLAPGTLFAHAATTWCLRVAGKQGSQHAARRRRRLRVHTAGPSGGGMHAGPALAWPSVGPEKLKKMG